MKTQVIIKKLSKKIRFILFPIAFLYGSVVACHRWLHRIGWLKTTQFDLPVVNIGNLSVGGTGKSPHLEYVHQLLAASYQLAIVSRGYNRKTKGVNILTEHSTALEVGDEPLQFKLKFPTTTVVVAEKRAAGIQQLLMEYPAINCILLDDAFQHWAIRPSVQILLTTFEQPFFEDWLLPLGRLREFRRGYQRADIIIVSKCPPEISEKQRKAYLDKLQLLPHQRVFFSYFKYQQLYALLDVTKKINWDDLRGQAMLVVTAIADTSYLEQFVDAQSSEVSYLRFEDHHYFSLADMASIRQKGQNKILITTQKDATRLMAQMDYILQNKLAFYVLPIEVELAFGEVGLFEESLLDLLGSPKY